MTDGWRILLGLVGSVITLGVFVIGVTFRMGHHAARIEQLEQWRNNVRMDMHEISNEIQDIGKKLTAIMTMLDERTERRNHERPQ